MNMPRSKRRARNDENQSEEELTNLDQGLVDLNGLAATFGYCRHNFARFGIGELFPNDFLRFRREIAGHVSQRVMCVGLEIIEELTCLLSLQQNFCADSFFGVSRFILKPFDHGEFVCQPAEQDFALSKIQ